MRDTVWGDILHVDLATGKIEREPMSEELRLNFIGGRGVNSKILYDEIQPGTEPLSPQNVLVFGTGPLTGTYAPSCGRWTASAKSPLSGILGDGNAGGHWAAELKFAGVQHVVLHGKADKPVYLCIDDDKVELRDAAHLWGKDAWETQKIIKDEWRDPRVQSMVIGQAGENLVKYACTLNSITKAAGRTGTGCVMGSKKLKAIAVRGTKGLRVARPEAFKKAALEARRLQVTHPNYKKFEQYGTPGDIDHLYDRRETGAYNHSRSGLDHTDLCGDGDKSKRNISKYAIKHRACFACPLGCIHRYVVKDGPYAGTFGDGPETTGIAAVGLNCGVDYYPAILRLTTITNWWGLDCWDYPNIMAFAMDLYERGIITKEDTGGIDLSFGNHEVLMEMARKVAFREGFGDVLAEGAKAVGDKYGEKAQYLCPQIKGLMMGTGDYRSQPGAALSFVTSTRGACHLRGYPTEEVQGVWDAEVIKERFGTTELPPRTSYEGKAKIVVWEQHFCALQDSITACRFTGGWTLGQRFQPKHYAALLSAATGVDFSSDDVMNVGERIYNVERSFNCREGITRKNDVMPRRFFDEPYPDGPYKGCHFDQEKFEKMKDEYYTMRGWDLKTGIPARAKLEELGLKHIADELESLKIPA